MKFLWAVTLLWAFSFSLIGHVLSGEVDGYVAVFVRMSLATLLFAPFLRVQSIENKQKFQLMAIGGVQIGLMYLFLYHSFLFLSVAEVLLFTIFTPLFVMLFDNLLSQRFKLRWFGPVVLGIIGAGVIRYHTLSEYFFLGFFSFTLGVGGAASDPRRASSDFVGGGSVDFFFDSLIFFSVTASSSSAATTASAAGVGAAASKIFFLRSASTFCFNNFTNWRGVLTISAWPNLV